MQLDVLCCTRLVLRDSRCCLLVPTCRRKLALIVLSVFFSSQPEVASYWAVIAMIVALALQIHYHPFESHTLNRLETLSISTTIATQFGSILYAALRVLQPPVVAHTHCRLLCQVCHRPQGEPNRGDAVPVPHQPVHRRHLLREHLPHVAHSPQATAPKELAQGRCTCGDASQWCWEDGIAVTSASSSQRNRRDPR